MRLADFRPLAAVEGVRFISVQRPVPEHERADMQVFGDMLDTAEALKDFSDTAGLLENLDVLITIDSGVCHLAGAMGRPVWVLLARPNDFRWMLQRSDTPWYPSMRLFRQPEVGDWASAIQAVKLALEALVAERRS